jgi:hypothetical protein
MVVELFASPAANTRLVRGPLYDNIKKLLKRVLLALTRGDLHGYGIMLEA